MRSGDTGNPRNASAPTHMIQLIFAVSTRNRHNFSSRSSSAILNPRLGYITIQSSPVVSITAVHTLLHPASVWSTLQRSTTVMFFQFLIISDEVILPIWWWFPYNHSLGTRWPKYDSYCLLTASGRYCFNPAFSSKRKVKEADLYSAFIEVSYTQGAQVRITQCYLQTTSYLPLPRKHSPDGASQTEVADI